MRFRILILLLIASFGMKLTMRAQCTNYTITVTDDNGAEEVSWELYDSFGGLVLSGGAPYDAVVCLEDDCYTLWMYDTGGDGWGGIDFFIEDFIGNFDFDTNLADGNSGVDQFATGAAVCGGACPPGQALYTITVDDGNDAADVYWELYDSAFNIVAAGFAPDEQQLCLYDDCYTLYMYDNSGDGWTGETWTIEDDQANLIFAGFLAFGSFASESFVIGNASCAPPCLFYTIDVSDGVDAPDVYWELIDSFGVLQTSGGANESQTICLLEDCYTLVLNDFAGNGWEEVVLTISEGSSGFFYQTFLVAGSQSSETLAIGNVDCTDPVTCGAGLTEYTFSVSNGSAPSEISWYFTLNNGLLQGGGAPYNGGVCLGNGCYYLHMADSGGDGWNGATYVLTDPAGLTIASGTLAAGASDWVLINIGGLNCTGTEPPPPGACGSSPPTSDCFSAPCVCDVFSFHITPSGFGAINDVPPPGSFSNPSFSGPSIPPPWGGNAPYGCLLAGELNSYWMTFTIATSGTLQFSLGAGGQQVGFYDWALWPYNGASSCSAIAGNTLAPVRCVWNSASFGGTGLASTPPAGGNIANYAPPLNVTAGQQFILCMSNWSYVDAMVTLDFFGTATIACNLLLPTEMLSFSAMPESEDVHINWRTASEINNAYFIVEHSTDKNEWIEIGQVEGHGTSDLMNDYEFYDRFPSPGLNYYRLKQFDYDGEWKRSEIRAVQFESPEHFALAPNPANSVVKITAHADDLPYELVIFDSMGRQVERYNTVNESVAELQTEAFPAGSYYLHILAASGKKVMSLVVLHQ